MRDKEIKMLTRMVFILNSGRKVFNKLNFSLYLQNSGNKEEMIKKKNKDEVKNELVRSLVEGCVHKNEEIAKRTEKITNIEKTILVIKTNETIIRSKKKSILNVAFWLLFKASKEYTKLFWKWK